MAVIAFTTADLIAAIGFIGVLGLLYWISRKKPVPSRIEWPRAEETDMASGRYMNPRAEQHTGKTRVGL